MSGNLASSDYLSDQPEGLANDVLLQMQTHIAQLKILSIFPSVIKDNSHYSTKRQSRRKRL